MIVTIMVSRRVHGRFLSLGSWSRPNARRLLRVLAVAVLVCAGSAESASATPTPPSIIKQFSTAHTVVNSTVTVYFLIRNFNSGAGSTLTNVSFTDTLPPGLVVANPNQASTDCGGTITAAPASSSIAFSGGTIDGVQPDRTGATCNVSVQVLATTQGTKDNTTDAVSATESGAGSPSNTASLEVAATATIAPPTISKRFSTTSTPVNKTLAVYFTITNPNKDENATTLNNVSFSDSLPAGLVVATPNQASTDCGGTLTATPGSSSITFTGGTIAPALPPDDTGGTCNVAVELAATTTGTKNNTTGAVSATEGTGSASNTASVDVTSGPTVMAPTLAKAFGVAKIKAGEVTSLTFTLNNPNAHTSLVNVGFTDPLPAGLRVADPNGVGGTCLSDLGANVSAPPGAGSIELSGLVLADQSHLPAQRSCTLSVDVTGTAAGVQSNTTDPVAGAYDDGGGGYPAVTGSAASASITVIGPPLLGKAFGAKSIAAGETTVLSFAVVNPNPQDSLSAIGFTDALPPGLLVANPNGLTGSCGGGTITATPDSGAVSLSGAALAAASSCVFSVRVRGTTGGVQQNTTGAITSTEGGSGTPASASIFVGLPPALTKTFTPGSIPRGARATLAFTLSNPNPTSALTGLAFTDALPAGLVVAAPSQATDTCSGGHLTAQPGKGTIALTGGQLAGGQTCSVSVAVTGIRAGVQRNTSGPVTSVEAKAGNSASASLTVIGPPSVTIRTPRNRARYALHKVVQASYRCKDDSRGPGIRSCRGTVRNRARLRTSRAGRYSFTVTARSKDGLRTSKTVHYTVSRRR
jgi:fimbrial isopeptide formation D2 family protein/uncharacterized repeat protein (TIGR01451 family)